MEIILKTDVPKLGKTLDIVNVKAGYARNYLFPQKLAIRATALAKVQIEKNRTVMEARLAKEKEGFQGLAAKVSDSSVTLQRKVAEGEQLYGSVNSADVADALKAQGFDIDKRQVVLESPIKQLGVYTVTLQLFNDVEAKVKVWVIKEE